MELEKTKAPIVFYNNLMLCGLQLTYIYLYTSRLATKLK